MDEPPIAVKPLHKVIRLDTIITDTVATRNYTNVEPDTEPVYDQKIGEERIVKAKKNVDAATHKLEQAKENFYQMDKEQRETMDTKTKSVMINAASAKYLKSQRPEMLKILLPEM